MSELTSVKDEHPSDSALESDSIGGNDRPLSREGNEGVEGCLVRLQSFGWTIPCLFDMCDLRYSFLVAE